MKTSRRPSKDYVRAIIAQEASLAGIDVNELLNSSSRRAVAARRRTLRRIKLSTGCSTYGLAAVFGCDHGAVLDALDAPEPEPPPPRKAPSGFCAPPQHELSMQAALACFEAIDRYHSRRGIW